MSASRRQKPSFHDLPPCEHWKPPVGGWCFHHPNGVLVCPAELRATANLLSRVRLIWLVQSHLQKYFCSPRTQITPISAAIPPHLRGVSRSSRTLGAGCDGREDAADEQRMRGRRSRVVLTPRRWRQAGGVIRRRRWQTSPVTGESTKETVKTIRVRECRVIPVRPW
jgi:hypothetical protein